MCALKVSLIELIQVAIAHAFFLSFYQHISDC